MQKLQNQALRKRTGTAYGSSGQMVEKIAGSESVDTILGSPDQVLKMGKY